MRALQDNARALKSRLHERALLGLVVKSNAYGHGLEHAVPAFIAGGVDWLVVNNLEEAMSVRALTPTHPIYICGLVPHRAIDELIATRARVVVFDEAFAEALSQRSMAQSTRTKVHIKVETGTHRLGFAPADAIALCRRIASLPGLILEGLTTHYADIEDSTNHTFADRQTQIFSDTLKALREQGIGIEVPHAANSAATLLWPETHRALVRVGISGYGLWPSKETHATALQRSLDGDTEAAVPLRPALSFQAEIAQVKPLPARGYVGYGRTYRATTDGRIAVLPLGYFEGFDRKLSNVAHVLIRGERAPVRGRICMNMFMVDVSHIEEARAGDVATLIGRDGEEEISAEQFAAWANTIHYEAITRIASAVPRLASAGT